MLGISGTELLIILFIGFVIFGPEKLPQMGRTVGRAIRQFRTASDNMNQKFKEEVADPFREAVEPLKDEAEKRGAPLREDIAAIQDNLRETTSVFTDPFKDALKFDDPFSTSGPSAADAVGEAGRKARGQQDAGPAPADADPFADAAATPAESAAELAEKPTVRTEPLPDKAVGTVKKSVAASLYGLDDEQDGE